MVDGWLHSQKDEVIAGESLKLHNIYTPLPASVYWTNANLDHIFSLETFAEETAHSICL